MCEAAATLDAAYGNTELIRGRTGPQRAAADCVGVGAEGVAEAAGMKLAHDWAGTLRPRLALGDGGRIYCGIANGRGGICTAPVGGETEEGGDGGRLLLLVGAFEVYLCW
jgi:hypothetical protein